MSASSTYVTLISGSIAATGSTIAKQPFDRLKWLRQVSEAKSTMTQTPYHQVLKSIFQAEGVFGLFRGVTAAIVRNIPHAALIYTLFPKIRDRLLMFNNSHKLINYSLASDSLINTIAGSLSSILVTCITHPGDTLRVRYTVQFTNLRYNTYNHLFRSMLNEGIGSFYRGLFISCVGTTFRGGVGFGIYETLKSEEIKKWTYEYHPLTQRFSIGFIAGSFSTVISYPFDTVRRRMQVWGVSRFLTNNETQQFGNIIPNNIKNARTLFLHIFRTEGLKGYFKGLSVTMVKTPIATSISLTLNDLAKKLIFNIDA